MSAFSAKVPTSASDASNNPAARLSHGELRCPRRDGAIIGLGKCAADTECPLASTCELRPEAVRLVAIAMRPGAQSRETCGKARQVVTPRPVSRDCEMCPNSTQDGRATCSHRCAALKREMQRRRKSGAISCRGAGPDVEPFRIGKGRAK